MSDMRVGLKPGEAFKIRLLPREIMVCVAITKMVAPGATNLSLAQAVRVGLTELCEAAIKAKVVPEPDEFNYQATVADFRRGTMSRKVSAARTILEEQMRRVSMGQTAAFGGVSLERPTTIAEDRARSAAAVKRALAESEVVGTITAAPTRKRVDPRKLRFDELKFKSEQDPQNMEPREFKEMRQLARALGVVLA